MPNLQFNPSPQGDRQVPLFTINFTKCAKCEVKYLRATFLINKGCDPNIK